MSTTSIVRARPMPISCARRTRTRRSTRSILSAALKSPGVVAIFTGDDIAADKVGGLICGWMIHSKDGSPMKAGAHPALAQGKVRYVGDHVAVVIADTLAQARDAAEKIEVAYTELPAVVDLGEARPATVRRKFMRPRRATRSTTGISATRRRPTRPSPPRNT